MGLFKENLYGQEKHYNTKKNSNVQGLDYQTYVLSVQEYIMYIGIWFGISLLFSYTFYNSIVISFVGFLILPFYLKLVKENLRKKRKCKLRSEFRDAIQFMDGYLRSGYSVEHAMERSREDMMRMYTKNSDIVQEFSHMVGQIRWNRSVEEVWESFAQRSGVFQIEQFAYIFRIAKRSGGCLSEVIQSSMVQITEQIRVEEEIHTLLASKNLQMQVMNFVPVGILLYVGVASPELLSTMYETIIGRIVMSICLCVYGIAYYIGMRMMEQIGGTI